MQRAPLLAACAALLTATPGGDDAGDLDAVLAQIEADFDDYCESGALIWSPLILAQLAEGHLRAGRPDRAQATLDRAFARIERSGERYWEAELHRLRGDALRAQDAPGDDVRRAYQQAADVALVQSARALLLRAHAAGFAHAPDAASRTRLMRTFDAFAEGHDTPDLTRVHSLLAKPERSTEP
ncbi:MAG: hypothetical protein AAF772_09635 [Acidobacteriota bacterium]